MINLYVHLYKKQVLVTNWRVLCDKVLGVQEFANIFLFDKLSWIATKVNQEIVLNKHFAKHICYWIIYQSFKRRCTIDKQGIERQKRKNALHLKQTDLCFLTIPNYIINTLYKLTSKKLILGDVVFVNLCISNQFVRCCQQLVWEQ